MTNTKDDADDRHIMDLVRDWPLVRDFFAHALGWNWRSRDEAESQSAAWNEADRLAAEIEEAEQPSPQGQ